MPSVRILVWRVKLSKRKRKVNSPWAKYFTFRSLENFPSEKELYTQIYWNTIQHDFGSLLLNSDVTNWIVARATNNRTILILQNMWFPVPNPFFLFLWKETCPWTNNSSTNWRICWEWKRRRRSGGKSIVLSFIWLRNFTFANKWAHFDTFTF